MRDLMSATHTSEVSKEACLHAGLSMVMWVFHRQEHLERCSEHHTLPTGMGAPNLSPHVGKISIIHIRAAKAIY